MEIKQQKTSKTGNKMDSDIAVNKISLSQWKLSNSF